MKNYLLETHPAHGVIAEKMYTSCYSLILQSKCRSIMQYPSVEGLSLRARISRFASQKYLHWKLQEFICHTMWSSWDFNKGAAVREVGLHKISPTSLEHSSGLRKRSQNRNNQEIRNASRRSQNAGTRGFDILRTPALLINRNHIRWIPR